MKTVICSNCGKEKKHRAKNLCDSCYNKKRMKETYAIININGRNIYIPKKTGVNREEIWDYVNELRKKIWDDCIKDLKKHLNK